MATTNVKTYISETNAVLVLVVVAWILGASALNLPVDVGAAIGGLVVAAINFGLRIAKKEGMF